MLKHVITMKHAIAAAAFVLAIFISAKSDAQAVNGGFLTDSTISYNATSGRYELSVSGYAWTYGNIEWGSTVLSVYVSQAGLGQASGTVATPEWMPVDSMLYMCGAWDWGDPPNCTQWVYAKPFSASGIQFNPLFQNGTNQSVTLGFERFDYYQQQYVVDQHSVQSKMIPALGFLTLSQTGLTFPSADFGVQAASYTFQVKNIGGGTLQSLEITSSSRDFPVSQTTCSTSLSPNDYCYVGVTFLPYAAGARFGTVKVAFTGLGKTQSVSASGSGLGGLLSVADTSLLSTRRRSYAAKTERVVTDKIKAPRPAYCEEAADLDDPACWGWENDYDLGPTEDDNRERITPGNPTDPCAKGGAAPVDGKSTSLPTESPSTEPQKITGPDPDIGKNEAPFELLTTGDPIHAAHGNKFHIQRDYDGQGVAPLRALRTYNALSPKSSAYTNVFMGAGWFSNWDKSVNVEGGNSARVVRGDGTSVVFTLQSNNTWSPPADSKLAMTRLLNASGGFIGWRVTLNNFNEYYGTDGKVTSVVLPSGQTLLATYTATGPKLLDRVTDPVGRYLQFSYDAQNRLSQMTDPAGGIFRYFYDSLHRLSSVQYPDGRARQYKYEHPSRKFALTSIVNEAGVTYVTFTYDGAGRAIGNSFAGNTGVASLAFNTDGTSTVNDPSGATVTRGFQVINANVKTTSMSIFCPTCGIGGSAGSVSESYVYDTNGMLTQWTDKRGVVTSYTYNTRNLMATKTEAAGTAVARTTSYTYHPTFNVPTQIVEPTKTTNITYDTSGRVLTSSVVADGQTRTTTTTYNALGLVASVKGPRTDVNDTTSYTYDASGNLSTVTNPKGHVTSYGNYDAHGNARQINYPDGRIETRTFDARSRILTQTVNGGTTTTTYDIRGLVIRVDNPDGTYETRQYDDAQRLTGKDQSNGEKLRYTLDNAGRITKTETFDAQNNLSSTSSAIYDGLNRVTQGIDANGKITRYTYDANGNVTAVTDPNNLTTSTQFDPLNRPILVTDPMSKTTAFTYNAQDNVTSITDPNNNATTYSYSGFGENTHVQSPDTGTTTQTYNAGGLVVTKTDARSKTASYTYDVLGRMTNVAYTDGAITQTYDVATNGVGRLSSVTDTSGSTSYVYDANGRVTTKTTTINAPVGSGQANITKTISYTRDSIGRVTAMTYPSGKVLGITYSQGRTNAYTLAPDASSAATPLISSIQYFPLGGPESWLLGAANSSKDYTRLIDTNGRIQKYTTPSGFRALTFDNAGRITQIGDYVGSTATTPSATQTFTYDNAGRLTSFGGFTSNGIDPTTGLGNAPITQSQSFTYDSNGNRLTSVLNGTTSTYGYLTGSNKLNSVTGGISRANTFDAMGNLVSTGTQTYSYDDRGRLKAALASGVTTTYSINYQQLRVRKGSASETRLFLYDESGHMLGEYDQAGNAAQELIWLNDTPVAVTGTMPCLNSTSGTGGTPSCTENATAYIFTDHLNTPREISRIGASTANGNNATGYTSLFKWDSLPFGETSANDNVSSLGTMPFNHRFPGQYRDKESGLNQNWHREYDPQVGRYITSDPIGLTAGTNTFGYVFSSPVNGSDKLGLCTIVVVNLNGLGHAGVYVDRGTDGRAFLYDPGGVYGGPTRGTGDGLFGRDANIGDYIRFQQQDNTRDANGNIVDKVKVFRFDTTKEQEAQIAQRGEDNGSAVAGTCVRATSSIIKGVGPFRNLGTSTFPSGLASDLSSLAQGCR